MYLLCIIVCCISLNKSTGGQYFWLRCCICKTKNVPSSLVLKIKISSNNFATANLGCSQTLLLHYIRYLPLNSLLSGIKMQPQVLGSWPGWKALLSFSLYSANRRKSLCQHVTYINLPHHSLPIPRAVYVYCRNKSKLVDTRGSSQFELLKPGQHMLLVVFTRCVM